MWVQQERPRGMQFQSFRECEQAKRAFRIALNTEHDKYVQSVYRKIDKAAELDIRLF